MSVAIKGNTSTIHTQQEFVIFSKREPQSQPIVTAGFQCHWVTDYQAFRHLNSRPTVFVIKSDNANYAQALVRQIRRDPDNYAALVFVDGEINPDDYALTDGPIPDSNTLLERINEYQQRFSMTGNLGDSMEPDTRLLKYMWLRPGFILEPSKDWQHKRRYRYMIMEALDRTGIDPELWINQMYSDRLLESVKLVDRLRECDNCDSSHLDFVDVCTNCRSINIERHQTLHCFACGMVAPEHQFMHKDHRICPKCNNKLKHIGTDYDRPVETHMCNDCEHVFVEGTVIARCAICSHSMDTGELNLRHVYSWRLSGLGRLAAQRGTAEQRQAMFDSMNFANPDFFMQNLDWMIGLTHENSKQEFSLFGIRLENLDSLRNSMGHKKCGRFLDAFADRLHELLGDTDIGMRADPETFYLLLPNGDKNKLSNLRNNIKNLTDMTTQDSEIEPYWLVSEIGVNHKNASQLSSEVMIGKLRHSLGVQPDLELSFDG